MGNDCCRERDTCWKGQSSDDLCYQARNTIKKKGPVVVKMNPTKSPGVCAVHWPYDSSDGRPKVIGGDIMKLKKWFVWVTKECPGGQASGWSSRSWKNGLAFAAMISKAAPDKFDFKKLRDNFSAHERLQISMSFLENDLAVPRVFEKSAFFKRRDDFVDGHLLRSFLALVQPKIDECIFQLASKKPRVFMRRQKRDRRVAKKNRRRKKARSERRRVSSLLSPPVWYANRSPIAMESDSDFDDFLWIQALTPHSAGGGLASPSA